MNVGQGGTAGEARKNKHCVHLQQKLKISEMWGAEMKCVFCFLGLSSNSPPPPLLSLNKLSSVVSPQNPGDTPSNLNSKLVEPSLKTDFVVFLKHICWEPKCWVAVGAIVYPWRWWDDQIQDDHDWSRTFSLDVTFIFIKAQICFQQHSDWDTNIMS